MRIDSSGRLLVGRTASQNDNIGAIGYANIVQIEGAATGAGLAVNNTGDIARININREYTAVDDDDLGYLSFGAGAGTSVERARITCSAEFTNANTYGGRLQFLTCADGAASPTERMRIDSAGDTTFSGVCDATCFTATAGTGYQYNERGPGNINIPVSTWTSIDTTNYTWAIPGAGVYLLSSSMRTRIWGVAGFIQTRVYDNTAGAAVTGTTRMMFEQGNSSSPVGYYNAQVTLQWIYTATGAATLYQQFNTNYDGTETSIQDDSNGHNYLLWQRIG